MKRFVPIVLLAGLISAYWFFGRPRLAAWRAAEAGGPLVLFGTIDIRTADLAFDGSGRVTQMLVEEGATVSAGQVLAKLDDSRLQAQLAAASAEVAAAEASLGRLEAGSRPQEIAQARAREASTAARLTNAEQNLRRLTDTASTGATSEQLVEQATAEVGVAKANLDEARQTLSLAIEGPRTEDIAQARATLSAGLAQVRLIRVQLADTELRAPSEGVIQSRLFEPGDFGSPGRSAYTLAFTEPKWVRAYVPGPQLGRVVPGAAAKVTSDTFPNEPGEGWVGFISSVAEFTPKAVETTDLRTHLVYEVRVHLRDPQNRFRMGMPVTVRIDESTPTTTRPSAEPSGPERSMEPSPDLASPEERVKPSVDPAVPERPAAPSAAEPAPAG